MIVQILILLASANLKAFQGKSMIVQAASKRSGYSEPRIKKPRLIPNRADSFLFKFMAQPNLRLVSNYPGLTMQGRRMVLAKLGVLYCSEKRPALRPKGVL